MLMTPPLTVADERRPRLLAERDGLTEEIRTLEALLAREPDLELQAALGEPEAVRDLAQCHEAAVRLPQARRRQALVTRALQALDAAQREAQRAAELGYAASLRDEYRAALSHLRAVLAQAHEAQRRVTGLLSEIEDAQARADALIDNSGPPATRRAARGREHAVSYWERGLGHTWRADLLGDGYNPSKWDLWQQDMNAQGLDAAPAKGGRR